jgi:hypothetical protein
MDAAAEQGRDPFLQAVRIQERLFTTKPIALGVEESLRHPEAPCGLKTDAERARHVRQRVRQMLNSAGEWENYPAPSDRPAKDVVVMESAESLKTHPALRDPAALERVSGGPLCVLEENERGKIYGRAATVADVLNEDRVVLAKWVRRLVNWNGRQMGIAVWERECEKSSQGSTESHPTGKEGEVVLLLKERLAERGTPVVRLVREGQRIIAHLSLADAIMRVPVDSHGVAFWKPIEREVMPADCASCPLVPVCKELPTATGVALLWRRLGLINAAGAPTRRGKIASFFSQGDGLAVAAALEDEGYPVEELVYDLANLDGGFRFCGEDNRWGGRLAMACQRLYGSQSIPGYLESGVPPKYGAGAEEVVASVHKNPLNKHAWVTELLGAGDIDRVIIEWRSTLRLISHAPDLDWGCWRALQRRAKELLNETESPTLTELPPLEYHQTKRVDHRLILRRH